MKRAYWFLLVLAIWCTACAIWYMFVVRGIPSDTGSHPHTTLLAIGEILLMLLVACLIGYGIGWFIRDRAIVELEDRAEGLARDLDELRKSKVELEAQLEFARNQNSQSSGLLSQRTADSKRRIDELIQEVEQLKQELSRSREELSSAKSAAISNQALEQLDNESKALRYKVRQLEFQNAELVETIERLKDGVDTHSAKPASTVESNHPFVRPISEDERDDLTLIKGIGPFIEKRLNMIGVYTYRQISEFTPEVIEQVTKAIEFFPKRIQKDDWVGQARKLIASSWSS